MSRISALLVILCVSVNTIASVKYTVTDLGTLGQTTSYATAINSLNQVVGWSDNSSGVVDAFLWSNGSMQDLGIGTAYGVNDSGQVVGVSQNQAFLYKNGSMQYLAFQGSGSVPGSANAINDSGQVAGQALEYSDSVHRAFLYSRGSMQDLGILGGAYNYAYGSGASGISGNGQVVGWSLISNGADHAFLYSGSMQDLGDLGGGYSYAYGVNNSSQVVGQSQTSGNLPHAFLYSGASMLDLGTFGGTSSDALGINSGGQIVGWADGNGYTHAFLYENGLMEDLNNLLTPGSDWTLEEATAINDSGNIAGYGINPSGQEQAFLLTPISVPEPSTIAILTLCSFLALKRPRLS